MNVIGPDELLHCIPGQRPDFYLRNNAPKAGQTVNQKLQLLIFRQRQRVSRPNVLIRGNIRRDPIREWRQTRIFDHYLEMIVTGIAHVAQHG